MFSCDDIIMNLIHIQVEAHRPRISEPLMYHFHRNKSFNVVSNPGINYIFIMYNISMQVPCKVHLFT